MSDATATGSATITNNVGLHARPSVKLTQLAKSFQSAIDVAISPEGPWVNAKSPVSIMKVKAAKGLDLHFRASGPDAAAAVQALIALVERRFDEDGEHNGSPE